MVRTALREGPGGRFLVGSAVGFLICGLLLRVRILLMAPLAPDQPLIWLGIALAQDLAVAAALVAFAIALRSRPLHAFLGSLFAMLVVVQFALSELVVTFGHPFRAEDLQTGLHPIVITGSAGRSVILLLAATLTAFLIVVSLTLVWRRRAALPLPSIRALASTAAVAAILAMTGLHKLHSARTSENAVFALARISQEHPISQFQGEAPIPGSRRDRRQLRLLSRLPEPLFFSDQYPLAHRPEPSMPAPLPIRRPNIVFLLLEGMRTTEIAALGGTPPGVTPNLDRLAREGNAFANAYSVGGYTPEGELALWYGLLASPYELIMRTRPDIALTGLPEILRSHGWRSLLWIHNSDQTLYSSGQFYVPRGFRVIDGTAFAPTEPRTSWGFSDRALMRKAIQAIRRVEEPFAAMIITISNHHPFTLPSDAVNPFPSLPKSNRGGVHDRGPWFGSRTMDMLRTVHYTDEAVGYFMAMAKGEPWFDSTLFVITGDHGVAVWPYGRSTTLHEAVELRHHVPIIFYSAHLTPAPVRFDTVSQADIMPTVLRMCGISTPLAGTGSDLAVPESHPVLSWALESRVVTLRHGRWTYHAYVKEGSMELEEEMLIDSVSDPRGERNLLGTEREVARSLRNMVEVYVDGYAQVIRQGRSGLPSSRK